MLCTACQSIFGESEFHPSQGSYANLMGHHRTLADLEKAAIESCYICDKFWHQYRSIRAEDKPISRSDAALDSNDPLDYFSQYTQNPSTAGSDDVRLLLYVNGAMLIEFIGQKLQQERRGSSFLEDNTGSVTSLLFAKDWIDNCVDDHAKCNKYMTSASRGSPTRLIEIDQPRPGMVRLWLRPDPSGAESRNSAKYFTLSHCWGASRFLTLTSSTYLKLRQGISVEELSQTFQDAVYVTQQLGGKFIWIDSLCIFQDSNDDWQKESVTMASIYGGSQCNIAAAVATDGDSGFLRYRDPVQCLVFSTWTSRANGQYVVDMIPNGFWDHFVEQSPLLSRGWVRQECLLAPRVLYFTRQEIFWACYELSACESSPVQLNEQVEFLGRDAVYNAVTSTEPLSSVLERSAMDFWKKVVARYTRCYLTHPGDKLIALAGVAQILGRVMDRGQYVAGLWRKSIVNQLVWYVMDRPARKPVGYRAPSWSWACIDGGVEFSKFSGTTAVKVLEVKINTIADEFSQVTGGFMRLLGTLMTMELEDNGRETRIHANGDWLEVGFDLLELEATPRRAHYMPLLSFDINFGSGPVSPGYLGLLLEPTGRVKGQFRRVGILEISAGKIGNWNHSGSVKNHDWFEYESVDSEGQCTISIV